MGPRRQWDRGFSSLVVVSVEIAALAEISANTSIARLDEQMHLQRRKRRVGRQIFGLVDPSGVIRKHFDDQNRPLLVAQLVVARPAVDHIIGIVESSARWCWASDVSFGAGSVDFAGGVLQLAVELSNYPCASAIVLISYTRHRRDIAIEVLVFDVRIEFSGQIFLDRN